MILLILALIVIVGGIQAAGLRVLWLVAAGILVAVARGAGGKR